MPRVKMVTEYEGLLLAIIRDLGAGSFSPNIHRELDARRGHKVREGALYTGLKRIENAKLVKSILVTPVPGRGTIGTRRWDLTDYGEHSLEAFTERIAGLLAMLRRR